MPICLPYLRRVSGREVFPTRHVPIPSCVRLAVLAAACCAVLLRPAVAQAAPQAPSSTSSTIHGTVVDPDGARVAGTRIVLVGPLAVTFETRSDANGAFRFERVPAGRYQVRASIDGFRAVPQDVVIADGGDAGVTIQLHVSAIAESVVVSASQVEVPLARAATSVTVLSADDLRIRQIETVADALQAVPGVTVSRAGGRGGVTSLFPRGGESNFTLVMVDGVKVNEFGGGYDFSALPVGGVERIEVVRGPESALFGADAIGAVVQVITRHGGAPRADAQFEGGSLGTSRASASASGSYRRWSFGGSAERTSSDGFTGIAPATGETVSNDDFLQENVSFSGGWLAASGTELKATANATWSDRGYPGPFGSNPLGFYTSIDRVSRGEVTTQQYGVRWRQPLSSGARPIRHTLNATYLHLDSDFASPWGASNATSRRLNVRSQVDAAFSSAVSASFGAELQRERADNTYVIDDSGGTIPVRRRVIGAFGEIRYQARSNLTLTAGLRAERFSREALAANLTAYSPRPAFGVDSRASVNPRVSAAWFLPGLAEGWTRVHASAGTGMRAPDALEIAFTDNPGLAPERSRSVELGVDESFLGERLVVGATVFSNRYDDLIVAVGTSLRDASRYQTDNISNARARGVELSVSGRMAPGSNARLAYTFLDSEILAVDGLTIAAQSFSVGDALLRRPRHVVNLALTYVGGRMTAFVSVGGRSRALDVEPSYGSSAGLFHSAGYGVADAGASFRIVRAVEVIGRVGNLFDRRYEEAFGYPSLRRHAMAGVRVGVGR